MSMRITEKRIDFTEILHCRDIWSHSLQKGQCGVHPACGGEIGDKGSMKGREIAKMEWKMLKELKTVQF